MPRLGQTPGFVLALALVLIVLMRWPSLDLPLDRDEGEYAVLAQQWLGGGGLPYRNFLEQKPPAVPLIYMAAFALMGQTPLAVRVLALVWQLATAAVLFWLALLIARRGAPDDDQHRALRCAFATVCLYALLGAGARTQGLGANTESFTALPLAAAAVLLAVKERPGFVRLILVGGLIGFAGLVKQPALAVAAFLPLLAAPDVRTGVRHVIVTGLGVIGVWLSALLVFAAYHAAGDFIECVLLYNFRYAALGGQGSVNRLLGSLFWIAPEHAGAWFLALGAVATPTVLRDRGRRIWVAWLLAAAVGVALSGKYYPHYFQATVAPLSGMAAWWLSRPTSWLWSRAVRGLALVGLVVGWTWTTLGVWTAPDGAERSRRIYGLTSFAEAPAVATRIHSLAPDDSGDLERGHLWIWGNEPELYFLTGLRPASRFLFMYPFTGEAPAWPNQEEELRQALLDKDTRFAVVVRPVPQNRPFYRELIALLEQEYTMVAVQGSYVVGTRKTGSEGPGK